MSDVLLYPSTLARLHPSVRLKRALRVLRFRVFCRATPELEGSVDLGLRRAEEEGKHHLENLRHTTHPRYTSETDQSFQPTLLRGCSSESYVDLHRRPHYLASLDALSA